MSNAMSQIDTFEYVGIDITTGFNHPSLAVRQGYFFGWGGSGGRSSTGVTALAVMFQLLEELLSLAAAATSDTAANLLPANSIIHHVLGRVTVTTTTTATFSVGDPTTAARFAAGIAIAATTTFVGQTHWSGASTTLANGPSQAAAAKVRVTPNATPGNSNGRIAIQVFSETGIAPTA
jgi:hypothetical protein